MNTNETIDENYYINVQEKMLPSIYVLEDEWLPLISIEVGG